MSTNRATVQTLITADNSQFIKATLQAKQQIAQLSEAIQSQYGVSAVQANSVAAVSFQKTNKEVQALAKEGKGLGSVFKEAGRELVIGLAAFATVDTFKRVAEDIDKIGYTAAKLDLPVETFQEFEFAAKRADTSIDTVDAGFKKLRVTIGEALKGNSDAIAAFNKIGLSASELSKLNPGEAYTKIAQGVSQLTSAQAQANAAGGIFGKKSGQEQLNLLRGLAESSKEYKELDIGLTKEQLAIYDQYDKKLDETAAVTQDRLRKAVIGIIPAILAVGNAFAFVIEKLSKYQQLASKQLGNDLTDAFSPDTYNPNSIAGSNPRAVFNNDGQIERVLGNASIAQRLRNRLLQANVGIASNTAGADLGQTNTNAFSVADAATKVVTVFGTLATAAAAVTTGIQSYDKGLKDLLGIDQVSGKQYLSSIITPKEQFKDDYFTQIATELRDNIDKGAVGFGTNNESLAKILLDRANSNKNLLDDNQTNSGQLRAAKELNDIINGKNDKPEVTVRIKVDQQGLITAFSESTEGVRLLGDIAKQVAGDEAQQTGF